ncbi:MAG: hypothetical protein QOE70_3280 [Chthoniobacter sp.]|nr:hypothetical protein [Chthoniobacter sp.]
MRTRLLYFAVCSLVMAALHSALLAHEDTYIEIKGSALVGLPAKYAPAEFDQKAFRLRIGKHAMTLHPFLQSFFDSPHDLRVSASWYHDSHTLPPYLLLRIQPKKRDFRYNILFNLDTLELIELSVTLQESESTSRELAVEMTDEGKAAIRDTIETLK